MMIRYEMTLSTKRESNDLPLGTRRTAAWLFSQAQTFARTIGGRVEAIEQTILDDVSGAVRLQILVPANLGALDSLSAWKELREIGVDVRAQTAGSPEADGKRPD
jgi:hypothetical protein